MEKIESVQHAKRLFAVAGCTLALTLGLTAGALYTEASTGTSVSGIQTAYASVDDFTVANKSIKLTSKNADTSYLFIESSAKKGAITSAKSSKKSVATVKVQGKNTSKGFATVRVKAAGKATITVNTTKSSYKIKLNVAKSWVTENFQVSSNAYLAHGSKEMSLFSQPGAKAKVKIGGKTYTKKIGSTGIATLKLKKAYSVDKNYKVTFTKGSMQRIFKGEAQSNVTVYPETVNKTSKKVTVHCVNMKKGDIVYFYINNVFVTKTMKKNGENTFTVTLDQQAGDYTTWDTLVKTAKGKVLYDMTGDLIFED